MHLTTYLCVCLLGTVANAGPVPRSDLARRTSNKEQELKRCDKIWALKEMDALSTLNDLNGCPPPAKGENEEEKSDTRGMWDVLREKQIEAVRSGSALSENSTRKAETMERIGKGLTSSKEKEDKGRQREARGHSGNLRKTDKEMEKEKKRLAKERKQRKKKAKKMRKQQKEQDWLDNFYLKKKMKQLAKEKKKDEQAERKSREKEEKGEKKWRNKFEKEKKKEEKERAEGKKEEEEKMRHANRLKEENRKAEESKENFLEEEANE
ncbi:hypothetical protein N7G274_004593 [Stereocaulon virgatum]|uniref:Uncharacterized protein n=1 Tax=Stereocaulon virgatum TaxID=373712 RepID=A0ABR4AHF3_9LECA